MSLRSFFVSNRARLLNIRILTLGEEISAKHFSYSLLNAEIFPHIKCDLSDECIVVDVPGCKPSTVNDEKHKPYDFMYYHKFALSSNLLITIRGLYDKKNLYKGTHYCVLRHANICDDNHHTISLFRLLNDTYEDKHILQVLAEDVINNGTDQMKNSPYNTYIQGTMRVVLVIQEIREQSAREQQKYLRKLSDDQIFQLFAWLTKLFGKDVANEIYLFCCC